MSGVYGYSNDPTSTTGTVGTGGGAGGVVIDEGNTTVAALNNAQRGLVGDMGMYRNDTSGKLTTGGSANAYTVTLESVPTALADGLGFSAIISASNTGATTINVNSLGAKKVLYKGVALSGGELVAGQPARFSYDASADSAAGAWLVENPVPVAASVSYSASEIANDSGVAGTNVDDALNTLDTDVSNKANLASPTFTGTPAAPTASAATNTTQIATTAFVQQELGSLSSIPSGTIIWHAANSAPTGFLKANGAAISRTTYAALYSAIGTTFGVGDGSTTFNVPDLRGEFARGWDDSRGVDSGRAFGSAQADELESHTHTISKQVSTDNGGSVGTTYMQGTNTASFNASITAAATGGAETRPRNVALLACIKF